MIFAETILLKKVKCTLFLAVLNRYRFSHKNMEFITSGTETIEDPLLLKIKNKELGTPWMSM